MIDKNEFFTVLNKMILSASGWRGVFGEDEESKTDRISPAHRIIAAAAALVFAEYLHTIYECSSCCTVLNESKWRYSNNAQVFQSKTLLIGTDTRPTGKAIAEAMIPVLLACGCKVKYAGVVAAPEIMAWAGSKGTDYESAGFIYISASHNPIGHNGIKFGLADGGILASDESVKLIKNFRLFLEEDSFIEKIESRISSADDEQIDNVYAGIATAKSEAYKAYNDFCNEVIWGNSSVLSASLREAIYRKPFGMVCDFNGSARTVSIDRELFSALGLKFECINGEPGKIVHRIVPEGESLEPCCALLEDAHSRDASFLLGYVPDCDGDRGNLVIWDRKARALEAQEVFALACVAEFAQLVRTGELDNIKAAVVINDPTSARIDRIAEAFGITVFRAEVGEANVVALARCLRTQGYTVRISGEGSAGGNITHPSAVRDPINTVLAIVKLYSLRSSAGKPGLFEIWCKCSGQMEKYHDDFTLADIITSLPRFTTTPVYSDNAVMNIKTNDHAVLKDRYQKIFLRQWKERKVELRTRYGFCKWEAAAYNGLEERQNIRRFAEAGNGGLKIRFLSEEDRELAYIWMRGSATEPVLRIIADVDDNNGQGVEIEHLLLGWQRSMITEADKE